MDVTQNTRHMCRMPGSQVPSIVGGRSRERQVLKGEMSIEKTLNYVLHEMVEGKDLIALGTSMLRDWEPGKRKYLYDHCLWVSPLAVHCRASGFVKAAYRV